MYSFGTRRTQEWKHPNAGMGLEEQKYNPGTTVLASGCGPVIETRSRDLTFCQTQRIWELDPKLLQLASLGEREEKNPIQKFLHVHSVPACFCNCLVFPFIILRQLFFRRQHSYLLLSSVLTSV